MSEKLYSAEVVNDLLDVLASAMIYIELKHNAGNPFVRQLGEVKEENIALEEMKKCVENASYLVPEIEALVEEREKLHKL